MLARIGKPQPQRQPVPISPVFQLSMGHKILLLLSLVLMLMPGTHARNPPNDESLEHYVAVSYTCQQMIKGLTQDPRRFSGVDIIGNVTCQEEDWLQDEALHVRNSVVIRGDSRRMTILDFGAADGVIEIHSDAVLVFSGLTILHDSLPAEAAEDPAFQFPFPAATKLRGGKVIYENVFMGYRSCGDNQDTPHLNHTYWMDYSVKGSTVRACDTAAVCGEGMEAHIPNVPHESRDHCEDVMNIFHRQSPRHPLSANIVLTFAIMLPVTASLVLLFVTMQLRHRWRNGSGLGPRNHDESSSIDIQNTGEVTDDQRCMLDSDRERQALVSQGGNSTSPTESSEYPSFPADDGLILDMEFVLGMGSHGSKVYKGKYHGHTVAVRVVECAGNPDDALRTPREVRINKKLSHPNVVKTVFSGAFFTGGEEEELSESDSNSASMDLPGPPSVPFNTFVVMEHCEVGSLQSSMHRGFFIENDDFGGCKLDARLMMMCMLDVARGMQHIHENGIIHAALHPKNILLKLDKEDERGFFCKLGDFCLSRKLPANAPYVNTNNLSDISVMPPETLRDGILTFKADVYSFGIMLWTMMAQQAPYEGLLCKDIRERVIAGNRPKIPDFVDEGLASLILQCWHHDPQRRPTFGQVVPVLEGLTRQYAPRLRIGLHSYLDSMSSAECEKGIMDEEEDVDGHRYLKIRFDPSVALGDGDGDQTGRSHTVPPEICRAVWARSEDCRPEIAQPKQQQSIRASGPHSSEPVESLGPRHVRRESQAKAHEAFVRAVDEMIQQSKHSRDGSSLNEFLDALKFHVRQNESPALGDTT